LPIKGRLGYTRINKNWCNTTKTLTLNNSSSDQIAKRKQAAFNCKCNTKDKVNCTHGTSNENSCNSCINSKDCDNKKRQSNRYCYPRPMATGKCRGLIDDSTQKTIACLRKAQCNQ
jgi:hypothetical protein